MDDDERLIDQFERHRERLLAIATRLLGSPAEAEDTVQEAWIRLSRTDPSAVENLGGWLTTVVSRVAIDQLRARAGHDTPLEEVDRAHLVSTSDDLDPETETMLAESIGTALLVVLETLGPAERLAFVLHDSFALPYADIAEILGRSEAATKQLAHRARVKVQGADPSTAGIDPQAQRDIVAAFLAASRHADVEALVELLDPAVRVEADGRAVAMGSKQVVVEPAAVAAVFSGRAQEAVPVVIDGAVGIGWLVGGTPKVVWDVVVHDGLITHINMLADPDTLARLELTPA